MFRYSVVKILGVLAPVILLSGCMFMSEPYREVGYYDLSIPEPASPEAVRISVLQIRDESATKYRMLFRKHDNTLIVDDYAKWAQPPGLMLTRYLESFFSKSDANIGTGSEDMVCLSITGSIFAFEADLERKEVILGVKYELRRNEDSKLLISGAMTFKEKVEDFSGEKLAAAMSACASKYAAFLKKETERIYPAEEAEILRIKGERLANEEKERESMKKKENELAEQRKNIQKRDNARTTAVIERAAAEKANAELEKQKAELELQKIKEQSGAAQNTERKK